MLDLPVRIDVEFDLYPYLVAIILLIASVITFVYLKRRKGK